MRSLFGPTPPFNTSHGVPPSNWSLPGQDLDPGSSSTSGQTSTVSTGAVSRRPSIFPSMPSPLLRRRKAPTSAPAHVPRGLFERVQGKPIKRYIPKDEVQRHRTFKEDCVIAEMEYCDKNTIRPCDLQRVTQPKQIKRRAPSMWNTFRKSKHLKQLAEDESVDVPAGLMEKQTFAAKHWKRINETEETRLQCEETPSLEQGPADIDADDADNAGVTIAFKRPSSVAATDKAAAQACKEYASQLQEVSEYYSSQFQLETYIMVTSSRVERCDDRFIVSSGGGKAFAQRMGWEGKDEMFKILKPFTKCVTGRAALEEEVSNQNHLVREADVNDKRYQISELINWYTRLPMHYEGDAHETASPCQKNRDFGTTGRNFFSQHKMTVHVSGGLRLDDFRSPTGTPKINLDDLRRIIPLLRNKKLEFRLSGVSIAPNPTDPTDPADPDLPTL
ncbi:BQ2448_7644 [Microbotryum intermedium]|uniref:BQ2448_7644 protein n=1 Tax=Microbotryum intermedium TaxID=269621 RepID=A0A238FN70_9BASI|nr:BQ2448_7644 [Microbotryum intermedium]